MIEWGHPELSVRRQWVLLGVRRASLDYGPAQESAETLALMRLIDAQYTRTPCYGSRRMMADLQRPGYAVHRKRVQRLMHTMGLEAIYPRPRLRVRPAEHHVYPDVLHDVVIHRPFHVWSAEITYVPMRHGVMSLVAILDWYRRDVLSWQLSHTMDGAFCLTALEQALAQGRPEGFNTDQGAPFTSLAFTTRLAAAHVAISMDGRGRVVDNIFVERVWRTVQYEDIDLKDYGSALEMEGGVAAYFWFYHHQRLHQALDYRPPAEVHFYHEQGEEAYLC